MFRRKTEKMCEVISIANQKGGIGKTTTAVAVASILTSFNKKTLLIDADSQGNSTDVYLAETEGKATLYDLLIDDPSMDVHDAIQRAALGEIIAADRLLVNADVELQKDTINGIYRLQEALKAIRDEYDYIVIDTNPTVNQLLFNCLVASDSVVIPLLADRFSLQGLKYVIDTINSIKKRPNPNIKISGILIVKYHDNMLLEQEVKLSLGDVAASLGTKLFSTTIRESVKLRESQALHVSLLEYAPKHGVTSDYIAFTHELIGE